MHKANESLKEPVTVLAILRHVPVDACPRRYHVLAQLLLAVVVS